MKVQEKSPLLSSLITAVGPGGPTNSSTDITYSGRSLGNAFDTGYLSVAPQSVLRSDQPAQGIGRVILLLGSDDTATATVMHCGQEARLTARSASLLRSDVPFRVEVHHGSLAYVVATAEDVLGREPRMHNLAGQQLTGMIPALITEIATPAPSDPALDDHSVAVQSHDHSVAVQSHDHSVAVQSLDRLALALSVEIDKRASASFANGDLHRRATAAIRDRCRQADLRALDLATELGISVRQLESMFKRRRSSTLEAIATARINLARQRQMEFNDGDLDAIARDCGFYDASHLRRTWTKVTGEPIGTQVGLLA